MRKASKIAVPALGLGITLVTLVVIFNKVGFAALQGGGFGGPGGRPNIIGCFVIAFVLSLVALIALLVCTLVCAIIGKERESCGRVCLVIYITAIILLMTWFLSCLVGAI